MRRLRLLAGHEAMQRQRDTNGALATNWREARRGGERLVMLANADYMPDGERRHRRLEPEYKMLPAQFSRFVEPARQ